MKITHMMGFTHVGGWGATLRAGRRAAKDCAIAAAARFIISPAAVLTLLCQGGRAHRALLSGLGWQQLCCNYLTRLSRAKIAGNGPVFTALQLTISAF